MIYQAKYTPPLPFDPRGGIRREFHMEEGGHGRRGLEDRGKEEEGIRVE